MHVTMSARHHMGARARERYGAKPCVVDHTAERLCGRCPSRQRSNKFPRWTTAAGNGARAWHRRWDRPLLVMPRAGLQQSRARWRGLHGPRRHALGWQDSYLK